MHKILFLIGFMVSNHSFAESFFPANSEIVLNQNITTKLKQVGSSGTYVRTPERAQQKIMLGENQFCISYGDIKDLDQVKNESVIFKGKDDPDAKTRTLIGSELLADEMIPRPELLTEGESFAMHAVKGNEDAESCARKEYKINELDVKQVMREPYKTFGDRFASLVLGVQNKYVKSRFSSKCLRKYHVVNLKISTGDPNIDMGLRCYVNSKERVDINQTLSKVVSIKYTEKDFTTTSAGSKPAPAKKRVGATN